MFSGLPRYVFLDIIGAIAIVTLTLPRTKPMCDF